MFEGPWPIRKMRGRAAKKRGVGKEKNPPVGRKNGGADGKNLGAGI